MFLTQNRISASDLSDLLRAKGLDALAVATLVAMARKESSLYLDVCRPVGQYGFRVGLWQLTRASATVIPLEEQIAGVLAMLRDAFVVRAKRGDSAFVRVAFITLISPALAGVISGRRALTPGLRETLRGAAFRTQLPAAIGHAKRLLREV